MNSFYKNILNRKQPYVIAEIGANHNGDMVVAKNLILAAKKCGANCVKFQSWQVGSINSSYNYNKHRKFDDSPKKHFGSLLEMDNAYHLSYDQHKILHQYCKEIDIDFSSTPFTSSEVDLLVSLKVPFIKIASMDINNISLLKYAAQFKKPMILSTGMATISEIANAVEIIESVGNNEIIVLHCISIYPPKYEDINLNNIPMLENTFGYPTGFSDHSIGTSIPLAAITLGSCIIEKHFTLDKDMPGWDHAISADPKELKTIVEEGRNIVNSLGRYRRVVSDAEESKKQKFRRSAVASDNFKKGHMLTLEDLEFKRPGTGLAPDNIELVIGRKLKHDVVADQLILLEDLK